MARSYFPFNDLYDRDYCKDYHIQLHRLVRRYAIKVIVCARVRNDSLAHRAADQLLSEDGLEMPTKEARVHQHDEIMVTMNERSNKCLRTMLGRVGCE